MPRPIGKCENNPEQNLISFSFLIILPGGGYRGDITEDLKNQLEDAALHTSKAFAAVRRGRDEDPGDRLAGVQGLDILQGEKKDDEKAMCPEIAIMKPILRLLQLLCENHNRDLQVG